jgi:hypothetical protein
MWNAIDYFRELSQHMNYLRDKYAYCRVTGINYLEGLLGNLTKFNSFLAVDDTDNGMIVQRGGAFFKQRTITVFILQKFNLQNQIERVEKLNETREIYQKIVSRLIYDSSRIEALTFLDTSRIPFHEVPGQFAGGTTGLYFTISLNEPISLVYDNDDWDESIVFNRTFDRTFG